PVQADHQRLGGSIPEQVQGTDDAVGDLVAGGDPAEDVHEHALHLLIAQDHVQAGGHDLRVRAAADVQEVRGLDPAVRLSGVGDHVQGGHHQPGAVADDADLSVQLDVVEVVLG